MVFMELIELIVLIGPIAPIEFMFWSVGEEAGWYADFGEIMALFAMEFPHRQGCPLSSIRSSWDTPLRVRTSVRVYSNCHSSPMQGWGLYARGSTAKWPM